MASIYFQRHFAQAFTFVFYILAASILISTIYAAIQQAIMGEEITQVIIKIINGSVISIAVFELAMVIGQEYGQEADHDVIIMLRRTLPRFIGTVCVALSLEGLIMVIKYSQLDLAGNLYYPVAILVSAALLLMSLGVFLKLAPPQVDKPQNT